MSRHASAALGVCLLLAASCDSKNVKKDEDEDNDKKGKSGLTDARRSEAIKQIGSISRAAVGAYEREVELPAGADGVGSFGHALCKSASLVPAKVPTKGEKVDVADDAWSEGDARAGWKCLKLEPSANIYFQYSYIATSGYKGLDRGAKDPGPDGFQICAEADGIPGGKTTLICQTGAVNKEKMSVELAAGLETLEE
jgi:hypothetical protein